MTSTPLATFCNSNNILWFPIYLIIDGKTKNLMSINHPLYNGRPKQTDFKELSHDTILKRQALLHDPKWSQILNCIAMDTTQVKHIDIDTPDYDAEFDDIMSKTPYFKSMTKSYGRHILIKFDDYVVEKKRVQFKCKQVELLAGQWSYAPMELFNADKEITTLTNIKDMLEITDTKVTKETKEHTFLPICISPVTVATDLDLTECNSEISKLLAVIGSARCSDGKHSEWNSVAQAIKNETKDDGLSDFVNWTNKYGTENKKKESIVQYQKHVKYTPKSDKKRLTLGSLHYWAKQDNSTDYFIAFPKNAPTIDVGIKSQWYDDIDNCIFDVADYDYAVLFNKFYKGQFVCVEKLKKEYYYFDEQKLLWQYDNGGTPIRNKISTDLFNEFANYQKTVLDKAKTLDPDADKDECEKLYGKVKKVADIMIKLRKTGDKNNILCEISDLCKDTDFPTTLNKNEYFLPTNDGKILNMKTLLVSDRTIEHKFSFQCNAKLIPFDSSCVSYTKVDTYFNDLFCGDAHTKQCVINILKSVFIGRPLRYIYFCIGNGSNGKSLLFKILNKIFGNFMDIISESVIIEQKGNKSALNTEIEKLDKCRLGYVTELKDVDKLNEKVIKQISGGDAINLRTLHTKDHTINPTCNMFVLTNEMPSFNGEAKSMLKRMITIPFKGEFETNDDFENEMLDLSDYIFSYIMNNGVILDKFDLSDEMIEEANKHSKNNTETTLEDYLNEHLIDCVNDKKENKLIVLNDLRIAFENDCATNKLKNSLTARKFFDKMTKLGYVMKQSNSKTMLYGKKFKDIELDDNLE